MSTLSASADHPARTAASRAGGAVRPLLLAAGAGAVAGAALWCSLGQLAPEFAGPRAPRLGLLPHPGILLAAVAAFAVGACLFQRFTPLKNVHGWYAPLYCTAIVTWPWLPLPIPDAALVWAGPAAWWIWGGTVMAVTVILARSTVLARPNWVARCLDPSRAGWTAAALAALVYGGAAIYLAPVFPGGDEPHYLVITQSLLNDGDLKIENNHQRQDYLQYYKGALDPHYLRRGADGAIYSVHAPGLPAVLLPAFAVGGYAAVVLFLVAVASFLSALVWNTAFLAAGRTGAAWFGWAGVMLSAPILFHAFAVYPEMTGAAAVMGGIAVLVACDQVSGRAAAGARSLGPSEAALSAYWRVLRWLLTGAGLALLPWLHTRYVVLAGVIGLVLAGRAVGRPGALKRLSALFAVPVMSAAAWFSFFRVVYGTFSPAAPYGHYTQTSLSYVPAGLQGLLLDQQFGLLPTAPFFAIALVGLAVVARTRWRLATELSAITLSYAVAVATYRMWWGGWSAPARFLVPVLPVLAVPAAMWWRSSRRSGRLAGGAVLGLGLLVSFSELLVGRGRLIFSSRDGVSRLYEWLSPFVDANRALPSLFWDGSSPVWLAAVWVGTMLAGVGGIAWWWRRSVGSEDIARRCTAALAVTALAIIAALEIGWRIEGAQPYAGTVSQLNMLEAAPAAPPRIGISYRPFHLDEPGHLVTRLRLFPSTRRASRPADPLFQLAPVPPGLYRLDQTGLQSATTTLSVRIGRGDAPVETWPINPGTRTAERTLRLPCGVNAVVIDADAAGRTAARSLALQPIQVSSGRGCPEERAHRGERYGSATVLFFDTSAYPEKPGFWVRGMAETTVAVTPDRSGPAVTLGVQGGAAALRVRIASGAWTGGLTLQAGEQQWLDVPVDPDTGAALARISTDNGFVPSGVDPSSRDRRFLGCWVTVPR